MVRLGGLELPTNGLSLSYLFCQKEPSPIAKNASIAGNTPTTFQYIEIINRVHKTFEFYTLALYV